MLWRTVSFPPGPWRLENNWYPYRPCPQAFPPEFKQWTDVVPAFAYKRELPYFQMMVPTVDTVRFSYLLEACLDVQRSVLFTGGSPTGPGLGVGGSGGASLR